MLAGHWRCVKLGKKKKGGGSTEKNRNKITRRKQTKTTMCVELLALNLDAKRATNLAAQLAARMI